MAYEAKTDWLPDDPINEDDVNRWEKGIQDAHKDLAAHKNDMNNPHNLTKEQLGLGNVDDVKQADYYEFRQHNFNNERHVSKNEKDKWNAGQLYKLTQDNGRVFYKTSSETTDYNELTDTGMYLIYNAGLNGPGLTQYFLLVMSYGNTLVQTAYDATNGLKSFNRIRKNDWETWTPWIEMETEEGAQKKVDAHANKTDIHVTKSDKDKWNGAQLSKITADHGGVSIAANEGEDILQKIVDQGRTMGTFYAHGKAVNSPSIFSTRGIFHLTGLSSDGKGMYGWVYATDYKNNVFTNYYDGSTTNWQGWKKLETEIASQEKADKALSDAKAYVQENFTNQKLTVLTGTNAIQDARTSGESYPLGLTLMDIGQGNTTGYPLRYGIVKNEKYNNSRFTQYFYGTGNESGTYLDSTGVWVRHWWSGSGWTPWDKISGFAHANIGTTGIQYLKKIDHTKIAFNRKIKDSHNAFDTTNNRFIAPNDGMYLIGAGIYTVNYTSYINFHLKVYLNGKEYKTLHHMRGDFTEKDNGMNLGLNGNATVPMNKGDYVEIWCYCNYGGDETLKRAVDDKNGVFNFFDIQELGGRNYPRF